MTKFLFYISLFLLLGINSMYAQNDSLEYTDVNLDVEDSLMLVPDSSDMTLPEGFSQSLEELSQIWLSSQFKKVVCDTTDIPVNVPDSAIKDRLSRLPDVMEMPYNSYIRAFIDMYTVRKRDLVSYMLGMSDYYFRIFEQELTEANLPLELKYLPVIESALRPAARSRVGAAGLWQFMISTGRLYGLEVNSLIDERLDPIKATKAATRFLKDLYSIYGDWNLVIAAYNCGPGNVNKAIRRSGGRKDYWGVYSFLPRETRGYVPIFIAANYAMNYAPEHKICKAKITIPVIVDTIVIHERVHLDQIAHTLKVPVAQLQLLNPQYRLSIVPGDIKPYSVVVPMRVSGDFITKFDEIKSFKRDSLITERRKVIDMARKNTYPVGDGRVLYHKVRSGQNLWTIARQYGVSVTKLKKWNNLHNNMIRIGQRLKVYR